MKKVLLMMAFAGMMLSVSANGGNGGKGTQNDKKEAPKKETKKAAPLKDHVCTDKCTKEKCYYAHGEKGHTCTADCKKG